MSGKTVRKKSPFGETYGFINMNSKAEMQLTSSDGFTTSPIPKRCNISLAVVRGRLLFGDAYGFAAAAEGTDEAFCAAAEE